jgi:hypothetical protein
MAITNENLKKFIEYFPKEELVFGINFEQTNNIESTVIWYKVERDKIIVHHMLNPQLKNVLVWDKISLNFPLEKFFSQMKEWEHEYCMSGMEENYQGDSECYTFFDYAKDQWNKKLKLLELQIKRSLSYPF